MDEHRAAALAAGGRPVSRAGAALVAGLWALAAAALLWWLWRSPRDEAVRRGLLR
jgi:hypothetical protein